MILLKLLFALFVTVLVVTAIAVLSIIIKVWRLRNQINGGSPFGTDGSSNSNSSAQTVSDRRDPSKARRKIFADDDGEYIDFVEED